MAQLTKIFWFLILHIVVVSASASVDNPRMLTLSEAEDLYLSRNAALQAQRERIEMSRGDALQAALFPNPEIHFSQEGRAPGPEGSGFFQDREFILWATQRLELGGKRGERLDVSRLGIEVARFELEDFIRRARSDLREAFGTAYYAQQKKELAALHLNQYGEISAIHQKRLESGDVSGLAQLRLELEKVRFLSARSRVENDFARAWSELAALIGWSEPGVPSLEMEEVPGRIRWSLDELQQLAVDSRPDLKAFRLDSEQSQENVQLQRAVAVPDLILGGGYKRDFGVSSLYAAATLSLPLFDRNQGQVFKAEAQLRRARNLQQWKRWMIQSEVRSAYENFLLQQASLEEVDDGVLERAERVLDLTRRSYQEGEAGLNDYLDTLRVRLETSFSFYDLLFERQRAWILLERAVGVDLK